ncbi:DNA mismatch endonuclease Vsr [Rhizobium sp. AC44/96]|uniref:DNA mismatch endonuclease Vsr n=1 Tax=Rhizobium sp. AC44/96 TaxID=1841654 RepID=UPI0009F6A32E|nr:DNA mismatch endonuclease Vsr [Rhizobium sp. AC44/96]
MDLEATPSVRRRMQRTRGRDNLFEVSIRSQLYAKGFRYRAHYPVPGMKRITCDIALPKLRIAVFLDGCFWHGCDIHPPSVKKNTAFWMEKIERNRARDRRVREHLAEIGWTILRFWEHEAVEAIVRKIVSTIEEYKQRNCHHAEARARSRTSSGRRDSSKLSTAT